MSSLSRRKLFGLFAGVAAAPLLKHFPNAPVHGGVYWERTYGMGYAITREELVESVDFYESVTATMARKVRKVVSHNILHEGFNAGPWIDEAADLL